MPASYHTHIYPDADALNHAVAQCWVDLAGQAIAANGEFHVALSGGTTPRALYERLASAEFVSRIAWPQVHVWFGDERMVAPDHADSNYHMAQQALLRHVPLVPANIHRIEGERVVACEAAQAYQSQLVAYLPLSTQGVPQFDLVLLGLGPDGHVASLFPGTAILQERARYVGAVFVQKLNAWRISLTLPVIDNARHVVVLVSGVGKAGIVREIFAAQAKGGARHPAEMINPAGVMDWYLDTAAAQYIIESDES